MKNYYSTVDNIVTTFSDVECDINGFENIRVYFERPNATGFDFAALRLPENQLEQAYGFSEDELFALQRYAVNNAPLIWEIAKEGAVCAQGIA